jgi:hypothetical protein
VRTYVVRVQDSRTTGGDPAALRGVADEIATGRRTVFSTGEELLDLLCTAPAATADEPTRGELGVRGGGASLP